MAPHSPQNPSPQNQSSAGQGQHPVLRKTVVRPAQHADPVDAAYVSTRLTTLTHDLANLLEGSLRVISLARRTIPGQNDEGRTRRTIDAEAIEQLAHQLTTLHAAMNQMAELVRASMMSMSSGSTGLLGLRSPFGGSCSVSEAVQHAADVLRPIADEKQIGIDLELAGELSEIAAGPVYAVIASAVRNSIEAIQELGCGVRGQVVIRGWIEMGKTGRAVVIEVVDDGVGPPKIEAGSSQSVFDLGFTTKSGGSGVGLAVSHDLVNQLGGTIQLVGKPRDPQSGRGGAVLRVCYPAPAKLDLGRGGHGGLAAG